MKAILNVLAAFVLVYAGPCFKYSPAAEDVDPGFNSGMDESGALSLHQALSRVFDNNPQITVSELEVQAAAARITQVGLKLNPELHLEAENIPAITGTGVADYMESTIQVSQRLEMGGKRNLRIKAAQSYKSMSQEAIESRRADLTAETVRAFFDVLTAQERLTNQQELTRLSEQSLSVVLERIAAGKVSPVERTLAEVELASAQLEEERQMKNLMAAKNRLAALWGGDSKDFEQAAGQFEIPPEPVKWEQGCPDLALAEAAIDFRQKTLASEKAARNPDITISGSYRYLNIENVNALAFSVSLPLPIFNKRQGAISEAKILLDKAQAERSALKRRMRADLAQARHERDIALLEADILSGKSLPAAMAAISAVEEGYRLGKFPYMNVLDAQRTYAQLRRRYIEAVASGLQAAVAINRLVPCDSEPHPPSPVTVMEEGYDEK